MGNFFWTKQSKLLEPYVDQYFSELETIYDNKDMHYSSAFSAALFPMSMDIEKTLHKTELCLENNLVLPKLCKKGLVENLDHLKRRLPVIKKIVRKLFFTHNFIIKIINYFKLKKYFK